MSSNTSPVMTNRFSGSDSDFFHNFDPTFTADISNKMQVPKSIRVARGQDGEKVDHDEMNGNGNWTNRHSLSHVEKMQMQVPDRIIVTGQEKQVGAKALPREFQLDTAVMPPDPELIRIQTPPRSITLQNQTSKQDNDSLTSNDDDETLIVENNRARFEQNGHNSSVYGAVGGDSSVVARRRKQHTFTNDEGEELEHLREQMSRMHRRLLTIEADNNERKEKERYLVLAGMFYLAYKTVSWLFRSTPH